MEVVDPSESICGQITGMEPRRLIATPGSGSGGNGGRSGWSTSSRRRRRVSYPPSGTRLMPLFNAAAAEASRSSYGYCSSSRQLDVVLDEWRSRYIGTSSIPGTPPALQQHIARLLFGSPVRSAAADDDNVLIMDGVPVGDRGSGISSRARRSNSLGSMDLVAANSPGSGGGSSGRGSSFQFPQGRSPEQFLMMHALRQRFAEMMAMQNMQGSPDDLHLLQPSLPEPAFPIAALRAVSSYTDAAITVMTPPRVTITAPPTQADTESEQPPPPPPETEPEQPPPPPPETEPEQLPPPPPETEPVPPPPPPPAPATPFAWPPTAEEDATIAQALYGPTTSVRHRLLVFEAICPAE